MQSATTLKSAETGRQAVSAIPAYSLRPPGFNNYDDADGNSCNSSDDAAAAEALTAFVSMEVSGRRYRE